MPVITSYDSSFASVVSLLHFDNDIVDVIGNTWTNNGTGCAPSSAQSKWGGYSLLVPSTSGYLSTPSAAAFQLGTVDFTIEAWVRTTFNTSKTIVGKWLSVYEWIFYVSSTSLAWGSANTTFVSVPLNSTSATDWHHLAVCRSGTTMYFLQNGVRIGAPQTVPNWTDSTDPMRIGSNGGSNFVNGYIDDLRITKGVARYTGPLYTLPPEAFGDALGYDPDPAPPPVYVAAPTFAWAIGSPSFAPYTTAALATDIGQNPAPQPNVIAVPTAYALAPPVDGSPAAGGGGPVGYAG